MWVLMKFLCVFSYEYNLLFSTSVQSVCKFLCFLSQEQKRKILTRKKGLEAETKQILFHPIDGGNIQNTRETSLLTWNLKKALVKQATFFRKKKKKKCFLFFLLLFSGSDKCQERIKKRGQVFTMLMKE